MYSRLVFIYVATNYFFYKLTNFNNGISRGSNVPHSRTSAEVHYASSGPVSGNLEVNSQVAEANLSVSSATPEHGIYTDSGASEMVTGSGSGVKFLDQRGSDATGVMQGGDSTRFLTSYTDSDLNSYLSRPIKIRSLTWVVGAGLDTTFDPWYLFLQNALIANRLRYVAFISAKLHLEFRINASRFHYGAIYASYVPKTYDADIALMHGPSNASNVDATIRKASQLLHSKILVGAGRTFSMCVPFHSYNDLERLTSIAGGGFGEVHVNSVDILRAASSTATADVTISIYAWITDVKLSGSTYTALSGPANATPLAEFKQDNVISTGASLLSRGFNVLSRVPALSIPMTAASEVTRGIASTARWFGLSKPAVLHDSMWMKPKYFSSLAPILGAETSEPLSFDPKAAVTLDPAIAGLPTVDELSFSHIAGQFNYVTSFVWTDTAAADSMLYTFCVHPHYYHTTAAGVGSRYSFTSLAFITQPFRYWSGSIKYRFTVVASPFHTGRIRISYDPANSADYDSDLPSVRQTWILDIQETNELTVVVPYAQGIGYLNIPALATYSTSPDLTHNGYLSISVENELNSPDVNKPVYIMTEVAAGEDFEVSGTAVNDNEGWEHYIVTVPQAASSPLADDVHQVVEFNMFGRPNTNDEVQARRSVYQGEAQFSIREYLKRYTKTFTLFSQAQGRMVYHDFYHKYFPAYPGASPSPSGRTTLAIGGVNNYNYGWMSLLQYLSLCYLGYRGSIRYKISPNVVANSTQKMEVRRTPTITQQANAGSISSGLTTYYSTSSMQSFNYYNAPWNGFEGLLLHDGQTNRALEYTLPYYDYHRFRVLGTANINQHQNEHQAHINVITTGTGITAENWVDLQFYVAPGEDFNFIWYLGPSLNIYRSNLPPPPVL